MLRQDYRSSAQQMRTIGRGIGREISRSCNVLAYEEESPVFYAINQCGRSPLVFWQFRPSLLVAVEAQTAYTLITEASSGRRHHG